jgi:hypothetical protein
MPARSRGTTPPTNATNNSTAHAATPTTTFGALASQGTTAIDYTCGPGSTSAEPLDGGRSRGPGHVDVCPTLVARTRVATEQLLRRTRVPQVLQTGHRCRRCLTPTPVRAVSHLCWGGAAPQRHHHPRRHRPQKQRHRPRSRVLAKDVPRCPDATPRAWGVFGVQAALVIVISVVFKIPPGRGGA